MRRDPLIIGAGPAGTAAAITLGRAGHRPILLEKASGPTDKVCGDFLSADTIGYARSLGVDPAALGAAPIRTVRITTGNRTVEADLPFAAVGLSRRSLDSALLGQAMAAGAVIHAGQTVRRLTRDAGAWIVQSDTIRTADTVFLATGKHDLRDAPRRHTPRDAIGLKSYLSLAPHAFRSLTGASELTLFPGGYAGVQHVEDQKTVLCIAVRRLAFQRYGGTWDGLLAAIRHSSPRFAGMLEGSTPHRPRPLAIAGVPYGYRATGGALFRLGDQAAVIPSLTGDGMAIALHSGCHAAQAWLAGERAGDYQRALAEALAPQMRLAAALHRGGTSRGAQATATAALRLWPGLLRWAASRTRLRVRPL